MCLHVNTFLKATLIFLLCFYFLFKSEIKVLVGFPSLSLYTCAIKCCQHTGGLLLPFVITSQPRLEQLHPICLQGDQLMGLN